MHLHRGVRMVRIEGRRPEDAVGTHMVKVGIVPDASDREEDAIDVTDILHCHSPIFEDGFSFLHLLVFSVASSNSASLLFSLSFSLFFYSVSLSIQQIP